MEYINYNIRKFFYPFAVICMLLLLMCGCKKKETFTVTFDANGGTGTMCPQIFVEDEPQALRLNEFSCDNCTFSYWSPLKQHVFSTPESPKNEYRNGETITVSANMTLYAHWASNGTNPTSGPTPPEPPRHEFVDLGLPSGTKWATCNVGADTPEEYGDYFAWGEVSPKSSYTWANYKYCNGDFNSLTKYCSMSSFGDNGFTDNLKVLEQSDDAATVNWGANWRTPTTDEIYELRRNCTMTWSLQNGVEGMLFTGPNGNSIFLPKAGSRDENVLNSAGISGYYWLSNLGYVDQYGMYGAYYYKLFQSTQEFVSQNSRKLGMSVRPVYVN